MKGFGLAALAGAVLVVAAPVLAGDINIPEPVDVLERQLTQDSFEVVSAEISRPKAKGDITLKAQISFAGGPPITAKLRKSEPGAEAFNNRPRYDLAAYELQKAFIDPPEYVVPPTALRMVPLDEFRKYSPDVKPTFRGSDDVLGVVQYWLHEVKVIADVYDEQLFKSDPVYARHIGQLNILTYLIEHGDSNVGNFLISRAEQGQRVFSIDNGVAFAFNESDRGTLWKSMRVDRLPTDAVDRLRQLDENELNRRLAVLAQWKLDGGHWIATAPGSNLSPGRGVRIDGEVVQMGLTRGEIAEVHRQVERLLKLVDKGKISTF